MNRKEVIINLLVIMAAFVLFVLWYNYYCKDKPQLNITNTRMNTQTNSNVVADQYKIYLITNEKKFQFWEYMNQGVSDMADILGLPYTWDAPVNQDVAEQINILNNAVANGANAILISALDSDKLAEPIRQAKAKGVKIIYVNTPANEPGIITFATNNYDAGKKSAESMLEELETAGIQSGTIGIVSVLQENATIIERDKGFIDAIKADNRFKLLDPIYTGGDPKKSEEVASNIIKEQPDLVGLFGSNEGASVGVGNAIKSVNNRIIGIGFDKSDATMALLESESLKAIIAQNPYTMGYLGMADVYAALHDLQIGPSEIDTGVSVIRKR